MKNEINTLQEISSLKKSLQIFSNKRCDDTSLIFLILIPVYWVVAYKAKTRLLYSVLFILLDFTYE
ncbi:MAG: hypothetical protein A2161_04615 [Candidatus Schekmanbacteria bacterium RBG_13_48_7]|uniref:Uncharacterized protein n=1 Tax=Candidatus Schekmanbacteria bacterium RBG_13_48_7 TaxID=1817878 RepID=A0A1F7RPR3_9BACT|nr:MAG: hypothetical protein A2161_04615 [Candidatus Schekmanbacteria bacterium RBG_13_48_7]